MENLTLHNYRQDGSIDYFNPIKLETIEKPVCRKINGLSYTPSGYGKRIPTRYMVKFNNKWRRVYCCIYSNIGTLYIGKLSDNLIVN